MALTGTFLADFSSFTNAVKQAEVSLKGFETGSAKVESQLNRMADSFSGRKVIQEATLAAEAIEKIGGPARLTQAELARVGGLASEAAEKFRAWGQDVPPNIARLETATKGASTGMTGMAKAIADTDNVLGLFGVQLGPARKALDDLGQAGGKTAAQIGLVGTASLAAGAALAGWELGRKIAEFGQLDTKIGEATAALLGWGDVAGEKAAAKAEMLAKASKEVGFRVTEVSTAMAINQAAADATTAANKRLSDQFVAEAAAAKKAGEEIERVHQGNADKFFKLTQDWVTAMHAREQAGIDAAAKAQQAMFDEIDAATKANEAHKKLRDAGVDAQEAIKVKTEEATAALEKEAAAAAAAARNATTFANFDDPTQAAAMLARPGRSLEDFVRIYGGYPGGFEFAQKQYQIDQEIRRRAQAVLDAANATGYVGPGSTAGRVAPMMVNMTVSGVLDPRTISEMTTAMSKELVKRSGTKVGI